MRPVSMRPGDQGSCGGTGAASTYFLLEPTNTNPKNNFPASTGLRRAHGRNHLSRAECRAAALVYRPGGRTRRHIQFPRRAGAAEPFRALPAEGRPATAGGTVRRHPSRQLRRRHSSATPNGHQLIGYWAGYGAPGCGFPLRDISPQWDVIIVAFATPDRNAPEGHNAVPDSHRIRYGTVQGRHRQRRSQGKKVLISFGGGGQHFTLADPRRVPNFISSITHIVSEYGFDGIDIDFESPSLSIDPGDKDFRHPTTPSIVNLISALRQLHDHFGPGFMISLVPEGTQIPSGYPSYGGQFGSYLPIAYALRDILSFMDVQDYNTPPLRGWTARSISPARWTITPR